MILNYIWIGLFSFGFLVALLKLFQGDLSIFPAMVNSLNESAKVSVNLCLGLIGVMALWLGIMKIGEHGGAIQILTRLVSPFFSRLFPEIPKNHPAMGLMMMNFSANMLGLDNAATPLGLKAMNQLQELNPEKGTATNAQIMFLVLNTSGLTLIPVSIIALRVANGAANPTDIFIPILAATYFSTLVGLIAVCLIQKINLFQPVLLAYLGAVTLVIGGIVAYFRKIDLEWIPLRELLLSELKELQSLGSAATSIQNSRITELTSQIPGPMADQSSLLGASIIFGVIISFILLAAFRKINVFESFIEGAREGFDVAVKIIPYLVAMLAAIGVFRASGAMNYLISAFRFVFSPFGDSRWVDALPVALMKPLSGSGARGAAVDAMQTHGVDSFVGSLACTIQGSTETTFYVLAVYFGAVGVVRTRYTLVAGLIADLAGIIGAIAMAYLFFGNR